VGNGEDFFPRNGKWNFNNKVFIVFSTCCDFGSVILTVFSTVSVEIGAANKDRTVGCCQLLSALRYTRTNTRFD
jgi:hypothetical protein